MWQITQPCLSWLDFEINYYLIGSQKFILKHLYCLYTLQINKGNYSTVLQWHYFTIVILIIVIKCLQVDVSSTKTIWYNDYHYHQSISLVKAFCFVSFLYVKYSYYCWSYLKIIVKTLRYLSSWDIGMSF